MDSSSADGQPQESRPTAQPHTIILHVLSPSSEVPKKLTFPLVDVNMTVGELKRKIQDVVVTKPAQVRQRLIYRGRPLIRDSTSMREVFGEEAVRRGTVLNNTDDTDIVCRSKLRKRFRYTLFYHPVLVHRLLHCLHSFRPLKLIMIYLKYRKGQPVQDNYLVLTVLLAETPFHNQVFMAFPTQECVLQHHHLGTIQALTYTLICKI